jgi:hypothetical protein
VKGIGIFVVLLLVALGVAVVVLTRPPSSDLDARERAWVEDFSAWRGEMAAKIDRAEVEIGVTKGERLSASSIEPLRGCAPELGAIGAPPELLETAGQDATAACGEVEYALALNTRHGRPALASTKQHLHSAGRWLAAAEVSLRRQLETSGS